MHLIVLLCFRIIGLFVTFGLVIKRILAGKHKKDGYAMETHEEYSRVNMEGDDNPFVEEIPGHINVRATVLY